MKKTYQPKKKDISRKTHTIDADGRVLGRLATEAATLLIGKHKPEYSTHMDMGDSVVIKNASKIVLTGKKDLQKVYQKHSNYPGGFKEVKVAKMREEQPEKVLELAIKRMLPKNRLAKDRMNRLKVTA